MQSNRNQNSVKRKRTLKFPDQPKAIKVEKIYCYAFNIYEKFINTMYLEATTADVPPKQKSKLRKDYAELKK